MQNAAPKDNPKSDTKAPFELKGSSKLTASEFIALNKAGKISTLEYVQDCIKQIEEYEPSLHVWSYFDKDRLLDLAKNGETHQYSSNEDSGFSGRMSGVPVAVKDIFNTDDMPTEHGSGNWDWKAYTPGNDARVVTSLKREGALMAGKAVTAELAVHSPGKTKNPYDHARTPGTSSSGSAVAVATGMCPVALASQTAGSTIRPASFCGVYGYKASFGVLPRTAMLKTTDTLDTVGMMARCVDDLGLMFDIMRVKDMNYPYVFREYQKMERLSIGDRPWKVAFINGPKTQNRSSVIAEQMAKLRKSVEALGCEIVDIDMPAEFSEAHDYHDVIYNKALSYYFKREWNMDSSKFSARMSDMINKGLETPFDAYDEALKFQSKMAESMDKLILDSCDVFIDNSANQEAPFENDMAIQQDHNLIYTMCHTPSIGMPLLKGEEGLPVGIQCVARRFDDYKLFYFAKFLEENLM